MIGIGVWLFRTEGLMCGRLVSEHKQNTKPNHLAIQQNNKWFHPQLPMTIQL